MDQHGIGTDASIPQHIKNVCDRHYVDVCGPTGEDGSRGQVIKVFRGKPGRGGGQHQGQQRPQSRHMVPRGLGLAFLSCFEELDRELCEPKIRAFMEQQVGNIEEIKDYSYDKLCLYVRSLKLRLEKLKRMRWSTQPSVCSLTSSNSSARAWRESTDISRPRARVCREREAGVEEVEVVEVEDEGEEEVMMEAGAREDGAEEWVTGAVEVT